MKKSKVIGLGLAASLLTGTAFSQITFSGYHESNVITGNSTGGAAPISKTIGSETSLIISGQSKLTNGWVGKTNYQITNASVDTVGASIGTADGNFAIQASSNEIRGSEIARTINPSVTNRVNDIYGGSGLVALLDASSSIANVGFEVNNIVGPNGRLSVNYAPNVACNTAVTGSSSDQSTDSDSVCATNGTTARYSIGYVVAPITGLTVGVGYTKGSNALATQDDPKGKTIGAKYVFGDFAVGGQLTKNTNGNTAIASSQEDHAKTYSLTYNINKEFSIGYIHSSQERKNAGVADADKISANVYSIGYNLGAAVISVDRMTVDNVKYVANQDQELTKVKLKVNF
jgi:hypothetical protein